MIAGPATMDDEGLADAGAANPFTQTSPRSRDSTSAAEFDLRHESRNVLASSSTFLTSSTRFSAVNPRANDSLSRDRAPDRPDLQAGQASALLSGPTRSERAYTRPIPKSAR